MQVTVYDKVPATAEVGLDALAAYLDKSGWRLTWFLEDLGKRSVLWRSELGALTVRDAQGEAREIERAIHSLAWLEKRQPSAVLADIAKEPT